MSHWRSLSLPALRSLVATLCVVPACLVWMTSAQLLAPAPAASAQADQASLEQRAALARQVVLLKRKIDRDYDVLENRREELQAEFDQLVADREKVDLKDEAAVEAWNKRREQYEEKEIAFNRRIREFNADVRKHNELARKLFDLGGPPPDFKEPPFEPDEPRPPAPVKPPEPTKPDSALPGLKGGLARPVANAPTEPKAAPAASKTLQVVFGEYWKVIDTGIDSLRLQAASEPDLNVSLEWREALVGETLQDRLASRLAKYQERYEKVERLPDRTLAGAPATQVSYVTKGEDGMRENLSIERQERGVLLRITISAPPAVWTREGGQVLRLLEDLKAEGSNAS